MLRSRLLMMEMYKGRRKRTIEASTVNEDGKQYCDGGFRSVDRWLHILLPLEFLRLKAMTACVVVTLCPRTKVQ